MGSFSCRLLRVVPLALVLWASCVEPAADELSQSLAAACGGSSILDLPEGYYSGHFKDGRIRIRSVVSREQARAFYAEDAPPLMNPAQGAQRTAIESRLVAQVVEHIYPIGWPVGPASERSRYEIVRITAPHAAKEPERLSFRPSVSLREVLGVDTPDHRSVYDPMLVDLMLLTGREAGIQCAVVRGWDDPSKVCSLTGDPSLYRLAFVLGYSTFIRPTNGAIIVTHTHPNEREPLPSLGLESDGQGDVTSRGDVISAIQKPLVSEDGAYALERVVNAKGDVVLSRIPKELPIPIDGTPIQDLALTANELVRFWKPRASGSD